VIAMLATPRSSSNPDPSALMTLLRGWLAAALPQAALRWLEQEIGRQQAGIDERKLTIALGLAGRKIGRAALSLSSSEQTEARDLRSGWRPELWATDEAARVMLLLATYRGDDDAFAAQVDHFCATGELTELVAYLKGFAIFPAANQLHDRAREGARSSVRPVFEAIACHNPYPFDYFDQAAWNQMIVKAVFVGASINDIVGMNERGNPDLQQMLRALISERQAAGRAIPADVSEYLAQTPATR
jgi:hypothetical protein